MIVIDIDPEQGRTEVALLEALTEHVETVTEKVRSQAARQAEVGKSRLRKLAEEQAEADPLIQAMIKEAQEDLERVPELFAAVARHTLERQLEPLRPSEPAPTEVVEGTCVVVEQGGDAETDPQQAG